MEEQPSRSSGQSPEKPEFQMRSEDFPTLLSTWPSRRGPDEVMGESSEIMGEPSRTMDEQ
ncbi:hypothetical protein LOAG_04672, partial [Loa loa]